MTGRVLSTLAGTLALAGIVGAAELALSRTPQITAEDGVYTSEQADRGQRAYERECGTCHGVDLRGGETSISLIPEPLRIAHLIARALVTGESRGRV